MSKRRSTPPNKRRPDTPVPDAPLSRGRRLAFTALMLALPVVFFGVLEGGLRLAGYGADYPLFVPVPGAPDYLVQNDDLARRYFANQEFVPNTIGDQFRAEKPEGTFRIFVQGGSSAAGFPFYHGATFSRQLQDRLQRTFPDREIEVVNTAMAATNSYTLRDIADEILAYEPDAVLVYAGHNEYYGALGVGSTESLGRSPWAVNMYLALRRFRTVQLLRSVLSGVVGLFGGDESEAAARESNTLMGQMVGEQTIPYGSEVFEAGLRQFRANLSGLLAIYEEAGVPVFVGTLASNERDQPPFVNVHSDGADVAAWDAAVMRGRIAVAQGDSAAAAAAFAEAVALDSLAADAFFALGRAQNPRDVVAARAAFVAAKDRDALRFRAPEAMNTIIREEAARHGATVVEFQERLRAEAPGGLIGHEHMLEHLHPTLDGYFLLADAFYGALRDASLIGDWSGAIPTEVARADRLATPLDSLVGVLRVRRLMSEWPFQPIGTRLQLDTLTGPSSLDTLAYTLYKGEVEWLPATERLVTFYTRTGDEAAALRIQRGLMQEMPSRAEPLAAAGNLLVGLGRPAEAEAYFQKALDRDGQSATALGMLGAIRLSQGQNAEALTLLERAVQAAPENIQFRYNLSGAYALNSRYEDARRTAQEVLRRDPSHQAAQQLLASLSRSGAVQSSP